MNKQRRKEITNIMTELRAIKSKLNRVLLEEQMAFDNMPENLQYSMRGETSQEAIESIEGAVDSFESAVESLQEVIDQLGEVY